MRSLNFLQVSNYYSDEAVDLVEQMLMVTLNPVAMVLIGC